MSKKSLYLFVYFKMLKILTERTFTFFRMTKDPDLYFFLDSSGYIHSFTLLRQLSFGCLFFIPIFENFLKTGKEALYFRNQEKSIS